MCVCVVCYVVPVVLNKFSFPICSHRRRRRRSFTPEVILPSMGTRASRREEEHVGPGRRFKNKMKQLAIKSGGTVREHQNAMLRYCPYQTRPW